ncbi:Elongation factor 1-alpha, partial [Trichinella spiralis]
IDKRTIEKFEKEAQEMGKGLLSMHGCWINSKPKENVVLRSTSPCGSSKHRILLLHVHGKNLKPEYLKTVKRVNTPFGLHFRGQTNIVACNKMDTTEPAFSEARFNEVVTEWLAWR